MPKTLSEFLFVFLNDGGIIVKKCIYWHMIDTFYS